MHMDCLPQKTHQSKKTKQKNIFFFKMCVYIQQSQKSELFKKEPADI